VTHFTHHGNIDGGVSSFKRHSIDLFRSNHNATHHGLTTVTTVDHSLRIDGHEAKRVLPVRSLNQLDRGTARTKVRHTYNRRRGSDAIFSPGTITIFPLHYAHRLALGYPCDEIVTRIVERDSVCVVEGENRCGTRARNRITVSRIERVTTLDCSCPVYAPFTRCL